MQSSPLWAHAVTKRIVENHGGEVNAINDPAGGLKVTISLISA
jgi:signal transduction histidine kinase